MHYQKGRVAMTRERETKGNGRVEDYTTKKESSIGRVSQSMERDTRKQDSQPRGTLMHGLTD